MAYRRVIIEAGKSLFSTPRYDQFLTNDDRVHVVNIVTLDDGTKFMVDVAFGGDGATVPIPMIDGHITQNLGTQEVRLVHDYIPLQRAKTEKLWIYQYRNGPEKEWNSFYAFPEMEFFGEDFLIMNWFTGYNAASFQTFSVLIVKFMRKDGKIYGKRMLFNGDVKENLGGRTILIKSCKDERERVEALKEYFDITLTEEEINGIRGLPAELKLEATTG
jgi:arylamine N-acetyltransferase